MAIVQISQIQLRRGLHDDLPQLASAEMGWSIDTRQLFIGNGTLAEFAPIEGITEILTEHSDFLSFITSYQFKGTDSGYTSQTGIDETHPVTRSLQTILDEAVISVRSFGAKGDGVTDDTASITRAIQQIYTAALNQTQKQVQRTIKFPAGTYKITSALPCPPNLTITGDGKNNTVISATTGSVFYTCDSLYQTSSLGTNGATMPGFITASDITLLTNAGTSPVLPIDSTNDVVFNRCGITGPAGVTNLVSISSTSTTALALSFNNCTLTGGIGGIGFAGYANGVRVSGCTFSGQTTYGIDCDSTKVSGLIDENNYYTNVPTPVRNLTGNNYSYGSITSNTAVDFGGVYSGSAKQGTGRTVVYAAAGNVIYGLGTSTITTLANGAGTIDYQITTGSNFRFGTFKYNNSGGVVLFDDEYTEPTSSIGANLYATSSGLLSCTVASASTLKYNIKQFV